ncbi:MAG: hypothetical protein K6E15_02950 [Prevotella sp.]|nr:hypothetical protein [Prevotella sp.]
MRRMPWVVLMPGVRQRDAWRVATRCLTCVDAMPGVGRGDAWRYKAGSICARHGRYPVGPCPASRSYQSRGWSY